MLYGIVHVVGAAFHKVIMGHGGIIGVVLRVWVHEHSIRLLSNTGIGIGSDLSSYLSIDLSI